MSRTSKILSAFRSAKAPKASRTTAIVTDTRTASASGTGTLEIGDPILTTRPIEEAPPPPSSGVLTAAKGGLDGGGWVTGLDIANDGTMVCRTDCAGIAGLRGPTDTKWTQLFRFGENFPMSEFQTKALSVGNPTSWITEVAIAPTNSNRIFADFLGFRWISNDRAENWTKSSFRTVRDQELTFSPDLSARICGRHMAFDPINDDVCISGHWIDGVEYTLDGGETWQVNSSIPLPLNASEWERRGVNVAFDRSSAASGGRTSVVVVCVEGRGVYKSTTGVNGTFSQVADGPTRSSMVEAAGGRIFVCGDGRLDDTQLRMHSGTSWSSPIATDTNAVTGLSVHARPADQNEILVMSIGGGMSRSTDGGTTWTRHYNATFETDGAESPHLAQVNNDYMALGDFRWHAGATRKITATNGIGVFETTIIPREASTDLWNDKTLGIQQKLVMLQTVTPTGVLWSACQDKPIYRHTRAGAGQQPSTNYPDVGTPIRHSNGVDWAMDDEDWVAAVYTGDNEGKTMKFTTDGGATWNYPATFPTYGGNPYEGGQIAVGVAGNAVWVPLHNNAIAFTKNSGATWATPTFRHTEGGSTVDMSAAAWMRGREIRRVILIADKEVAGRFFAYCQGDNTGSAADLAMRGLWESTDGGENWVRVRSGYFYNFSLDFYANKLRKVQTRTNDLFWARGNLNNYGDAVAAGGLMFSSDKSTFVEIDGLDEVEDIGIGKAVNGHPYPQLVVKCWKDGEVGYYYCDDFDPANPQNGTWQLWTRAPMGRADDESMIVGDMNVENLFYVVTSAGGFQILKRG